MEANTSAIVEPASNGNKNDKNDKEDVRRKLTFEIDDDDPIAQCKMNRKSRKSITSRIQNVDSLQICFLNDNNDDFSFETLNSHANFDNNNDIIMQNRIYYLFKKLQKENFDLDKVQLFDDIEKPTERDKFSDYHSKLYTEAKLTLSQIKEIAKLRIKQQKEREKDEKSIYDLINNLPPHFRKSGIKFTSPILSRLCISELQLIINDMYSTVEKLNSSLVKLLIEKDELCMEQDSRLVDIEDLTKFLLSKCRADVILKTNS